MAEGDRRDHRTEADRLRLHRGHDEGDVGLQRVLLLGHVVVVGAEDGRQAESLGEMKDVPPAVPGEPVVSGDHQTDVHGDSLLWPDAIRPRDLAGPMKRAKDKRRAVAPL